MGQLKFDLLALLQLVKVRARTTIDNCVDVCVRAGEELKISLNVIIISVIIFINRVQMEFVVVLPVIEIH